MRRWGADPQRVRDAATLLPVTAAILLLPPFILVFAAPVLFAGIPLIVLYVFGVWAAVVLCAWLLARNLAMTDVAAGMEGEAEARSSPDQR
jgi:hypothetical protein